MLQLLHIMIMVVSIETALQSTHQLPVAVVNNTGGLVDIALVHAALDLLP